MRRAAIFALGMIGLFAATAALNMPAVAAIGWGDSAALGALADSVMSAGMAQFHVPGGVLVVVKDGEVVLARGYGFADLERRVPVDPERTFFGHMLVERVVREDVRSFRLHLESHTSLSATSVWHVLSDVRCLLNWCADSGLIERSPFPRRVMPRLQERSPDRLTDEEAAQLLALPDPHGFVCRLALGTGLRWGELCRAQAADVKRLRISGSDTDQWFLEVSNTKSRKIRRVPLGPDLLREVRGRVGRLVPYAIGSPGSFAGKVRRLSGVDGFHVHQTRHTFACQWLERGGSLAALQQILGHASIVTTQRYARLTDEAVMREAVRLGAEGCMS